MVAQTKLPTHLDLPFTDGLPVDNLYQPVQIQLLSTSIQPILKARHPSGDYVIGRDLGIYWKLTADPLEGCKVPDWCYIPNASPMPDGEMRRSFVMWNESSVPLLVIELVSGGGTEEHDDTPVTGRFWVYRRGISANYYAIHDPFEKKLEVFALDGVDFRPVAANVHGHFPILPMGVALGIWEGRYDVQDAAWVRFFTLDGQMLPSETEREQQLSRRAAALADKLRSLGVDPDSVATLK